ncbi:hypothetical protein DGG96_01285 [Legionella qingyii]|uniref:Uncharacterized protein n=1 Tax=Legionella qingyii TaxID=2184757 RepID=A0A317U9J2_9GAMM|nr:hypothetical protein [Legionella qingyii]PWY57377.1 hypothetical protein DGG96_01285 [Legionella qingyii]
MKDIGELHLAVLYLVDFYLTLEDQLIPVDDGGGGMVDVQVTVIARSVNSLDAVEVVIAVNFKVSFHHVVFGSVMDLYYHTAALYADTDDVLV